MICERVAAGAAILALLTACGEATVEPPPAESGQGGPRPEPLVVFASHDDEAFLPALFAEYTRATGVRVSVRHRDDATNVDDVIAKRSSPQPDVLITRSVEGAWLVADDGMFRPLESATARERVPAWLRDPDGYWVALGYTPVIVAYDADVVDASRLSDYASLGDATLRGRLCLSAAILPANVTLVANLVAAHGRRPAEIIVRSWVANLALPPFDTEEALLDAIVQGRCALGIASSRAVQARREAAAVGTLAVYVPEPVYADAFAAGVGRHARTPDAAADLVDWLLQPARQETLSAGSHVYPVHAGSQPSGQPVPGIADTSIAIGGAYAAEAKLLTERASWR